MHFIDLVVFVTSLLALAFAASVPGSTLTDTTVDLQWALCDKDAQTVLRKLGKAHKIPYKANPITYYDTWPPSYTAKGLGFRTKIKKHDPGYPISLVKARFGEQTDNVPPAVDCVWDRYGNITYFTCALLHLLPDETEYNTWSDGQIYFAERYQEVRWDDLEAFGPFMNPKWKLKIKGHHAVFDDVMASDLHLMEIEVAAKGSESEAVYKKITSYLQAHDVVLCEAQLPKTLRLFSHLEDSSWAEGAGFDKTQIVLKQG
jgi:hypothetical protein